MPVLVLKRLINFPVFLHGLFNEFLTCFISNNEFIMNSLKSDSCFENKAFKDVRAHCFCASLLRTQIHTPRHSLERALSNK